MSALTLTLLLQIMLRQLTFGPTQNLACLDNDSCPAVEQIDRQVEAYMRKYGFVGAQLAVMKNNALVYVKGYGWADSLARQQMQPGNVMRVASVSKLITAVGIMRMQEMGLLKLSDKVFTPEGVLGREEFTACIRDRRMLDITIEHLLRHQAGFTHRSSDPMFCAGILSGREAVRKTLSRPLAYTPGTSQEYSNVGYYLLSLIIERLGRDSYENWMKHNVLIPMRCFNFSIAGNYLSERRSNEVHYYMHEGSPLKMDFHKNGDMVEGCYGANNITGLSGAGAWVTSAAELCRFVAGIDRDWGIRAFLEADSIDRMTEYFDENTYSLGWNDTNPEGVWTRTGSFGGTTAIIKNFCNEGECWVLITNTSTYLGPRIASRSSALIKKMMTFSDKLPQKDLFYK